MQSDKNRYERAEHPGADWLDSAKNERGPCRVLIATTEDKVEDTIKPRF